MFTAQSFASTALSGIVFRVVSFDGNVVLVTRSPVTAATVAARCNTGDMRVFSTDFTN